MTYICKGCRRRRSPIPHGKAMFDGEPVYLKMAPCECGCADVVLSEAVVNAVDPSWKPDKHRLTTRAQQDLGLYGKPFGVGEVAKKKPPAR